MKAIVLSCDRYRAMTDHMIFKYAQLWPDHPFHFRVPFQDLAPTMAPETVEYRKCPSAIKTTALALLEDLDDEEWVFWCIDDKYPIKINVPRVEGMMRWLVSEEASGISGLLFCRCRRLWLKRSLTGESVIDGADNVYLGRKDYAQIWIHQFLRVKVLRHLFESFTDVITSARVMDELKERVEKPASHRIFVTRENHAVFGESTIGGALTLNCHASFVENGLTLPSWGLETAGRAVVMGRL